MPSPKRPLRYHAGHRNATWLELFFDLVFVVVVGKVTHLLAHEHHHHLEPGLWWKFPLMLLPVWWIWMLHTAWSNLYDTDGKPHRLASLFVMLQMVVLSTVMVSDWEGAYPLFNASYFGLRLTFAVLYLTHGNGHDGFESFGRERGFGILIAALVSLSSALWDAPLRYGIFYLGVALDLLHPILMRRAKKIPALHLDHFVERMGLLIIILLGESVISLSSGLSDVEWNGDTITASLTGAVLIGATWWIYFDRYHLLARAGVGGARDGLTLGYPHFLTCLGLSIMANTIFHAIHPGLDRHEYALMGLAGMAIFFLGKQVPYYARFAMVRGNILINTGITLSLSIAATFLPDNVSILIGLTVALLVYVALNYFHVIPKLRASLEGGVEAG
ncbi:MAG: low temperature requirement protein A [Verrucomicrobiae bacterium]|nr:low temperature requirement protein A [Verrucomicrobiae bacterium]